VVVGLSLPAEEQPALERYLASAGGRADQDALLSEPFWRQVPRDGRSSRALLVLIERVRRWRASGLKLELLAYDGRDLKGNAREEAVAHRLLQRRRAAPQATLLVLGGNYHVRTDGGVLPWSSSFKPFGHRLAQAGVALKRLDTAFQRGSRWTCGVNRHDEAECRIYATAPTGQSYSAPGKALGVELFPSVSGEGFHGLLHVGVLSASLPALMPRAQLAGR
jgi:erythromycin esterase-like protein